MTSGTSPAFMDFSILPRTPQPAPATSAPMYIEPLVSGEIRFFAVAVLEELIHHGIVILDLITRLLVCAARLGPQDCTANRATPAGLYCSVSDHHRDQSCLGNGHPSRYC